LYIRHDHMSSSGIPVLCGVLKLLSTSGPHVTAAAIRATDNNNVETPIDSSGLRRLHTVVTFGSPLNNVL